MQATLRRAALLRAPHVMQDTMLHQLAHRRAQYVLPGSTRRLVLLSARIVMRDSTRQQVGQRRAVGARRGNTLWLGPRDVRIAMQVNIQVTKLEVVPHARLGSMQL